MQLHAQKEKLDHLNIQVKIVTFDDDFMAKSYVKSAKIAFPLLLDVGTQTYSAYGMKRGSWWSLYNPLSILKYLFLMLTGTRPGKPGKDWNQLGGNILIDPDQIVRMHYLSESPHDRPSVEAIVQLVEANSR